MNSSPVSSCVSQPIILASFFWRHWREKTMGYYAWELRRPTFISSPIFVSEIQAFTCSTRFFFSFPKGLFLISDILSWLSIISNVGKDVGLGRVSQLWYDLLSFSFTLFILGEKSFIFLLLEFWKSSIILRGKAFLLSWNCFPRR